MAWKGKEWKDGLVQPKTKSNPRGAGRVKGRDYSYLCDYKGGEPGQYISWLRMKAQCNYRDEEFELSWEDYLAVWQGWWHFRGRQPKDICLTRRDPDGPWTLDNCMLISRHEHFKMTRARQLANDT